MSIEEGNNRLSELEREIIQKAPSAEEAELVLTIIYVARYSAQYWTNNRAKWNALKENTQIDFPEQSKQKSDSNNTPIGYKLFLLSLS